MIPPYPQPPKSTGKCHATGGSRDTVPLFVSESGILYVYLLDEPFAKTGLPTGWELLAVAFPPQPGGPCSEITTEGFRKFGLRFDISASGGSEFSIPGPGRTIRVPARDPAIRTASGGYVVAGDYVIQSG